MVDTNLTLNQHIPEGTYACDMKERPRFAYSTQDGVARNQSGVGVLELIYFFCSRSLLLQR